MSNIDILTIIFFVAIGTYTLRVSGLLLSNRLKKFKNIDIFLDSIPATLLISLIVPSIIKTGLIGIIASLITVFIVDLYRNGLLF